MRDASGNLLGDIEWENSRHGGCGWVTGCSASADGSHVLAWADVCQVYRKAVADDAWTALIVPGKVPAALIGTYNSSVPNGTPGSVPGGVHAGFGGSSDTRIYVTIQDRVIVSDDGETFTDTAITGLPVYANNGIGRAYGPKGATDPQDEDVYYIFMGEHGLRYTLDAGTTAVAPAWCPAPSSPAATDQRYGLVAIDTSSAQIGGTGRHGRVAFAPCGEGIWLSDDGGVTGTDITAASGIEAVSGMAWVNGALYVCVCDKDNPGNLANENIRKWTEASGWEDVTTTIGKPYQCIVADPRYADGFWAIQQSQEFSHTQDGETFVTFVGDGALTTTMVRCKPRFRPLPASKYRYEHASYAVSCPVVAGTYLYVPLGLGVLRTVIADFPLAGADFSTPATSAAWPLWEEDIAGFEEIVGMSVLWAGDNLWCFGQDIGIVLWEDGSRGHSATVHKFPHGGILTDVHGASRGPDPDWIVARRTREGQGGVASFSYTDDGYIWHKMANQPAQGPAAIFESGHGVAGPVGTALCFPGRVGGLPQYTTDKGATPWGELNFFLEDNTQLDLSSVDNGYHGFQGGDFSKNHHLAVHDNANPGNFYVVNIGATLDENAESWVTDPLGWAGIYHMAPGDFPNFRRIYEGHPAHTSNFAYYDCKLLCDGDGHLVFISNYLPGSPLDPYNKPVVYDIASGVLTPIDTVRNCQSIAFGAPVEAGGLKSLWLLGWSPAPDYEYGLYVSFDLGASVQGPFNVEIPGAGYVKYIDAHETIFGLLGAAVDSRGHARGRYRLRAA